MTPDLGPATEARIREAFAKACVITEKACAAVIGIDVQTLSSMNAAGVIRAVRRGNLPGYTEADIRAYLTESPGPCRSEPQKIGRRPVRQSNNIIPFTERMRRKELGRRSPKGATSGTVHPT